MTYKEIESYVEKADKYFNTANHLLEYGDYDSCVSRAYYSMFYMTKAVLLTKNLITKTHSGTLSLFSESFIKTNTFPKEIAKYLRKGFQVRLLGDYNVMETMNKKDAADLMNNVEIFNERLKDYLVQNEYFE